ncbi:hypothetical protein D3H65_17610 [Paraflavitalea soli]|uniref:Uncharacterized protein n=1 Tax=Paraflavitalea soli TaxID=2315862 RepID=A0A3B7MQR0_9BACT|nr:hypothetical protein [Paraflavitalea soli]AXY75683.1 hypothetical protein D3H65_17610 [Paraflavitalea soli]
MARINPDSSFTGSLGSLSFYHMRGVDKPIVRTKGGASKQKIKTHPRFESTRRINAEFGGRATASKWIMRMLWPQKALADHNIAGPLNALMKPVQALDLASADGQRHIPLSQYPSILDGFSLNRKTGFDSIVRTHIGCSLSREKLQVRVDIPALLPGINLHMPKTHPWYAITVVFGIIPDLFYAPYQYIPMNEYGGVAPLVRMTDWYPALEGSADTTLELIHPITPPDEYFSIMISIGIRFGMSRSATQIDQVPHAGAARVLAMA